MREAAWGYHGLCGWLRADCLPLSYISRVHTHLLYMSLLWTLLFLDYLIQFCPLPKPFLLLLIEFFFFLKVWHYFNEEYFLCSGDKACFFLEKKFSDCKINQELIML